MWRLYFQWNRLIEVLAYIFSMIYIIDDFQLDRKSFTIFKGSRQVECFSLLFLRLIIPCIRLTPMNLSKQNILNRK